MQMDIYKYVRLEKTAVELTSDKTHTNLFWTPNIIT